METVANPAAEVPPEGTLSERGAEVRSRIGHHRALALVLLLAAVLFAVPFWWGMPSHYSWAFDEIEPEHLEAGRWPEKYPLVHRDLLRLQRLPVVWLARELGMNTLERVAFEQQAARLLSVLLALGTVGLLYLSSRELSRSLGPGGREAPGAGDDGRLAGVLSAAVAATVPPFVYYAKTANLEAPYLFWFSLSLLFYLRLLRRQRLGDYLLFAVAAVLSIGSKDQAYGIYVLSPLAILAALARHHRAAGAARPWVRSAVDVRIWATAATTVAGLALVHRVGFDPSWLPRHLEVITGPASKDYRIYPATLAGQAEMALASARHLAFSLGLPLLAVAAAGLWRFPRAVAVGVLGISYYLTFLVPIGYNYVRFFLPICLLLALPAGRLLARLWRLGGRCDAWRWLVVAVLAHAGLRAAAVDLLMLRDARYAAERYVAERVAPERVAAGTAGADRDGAAPESGGAVALGYPTLLPRFPVVRWKELGTRECRVLAEYDARFVAIHPVDLIDPRIVRRLRSGEMGYRLAAHFRREPLLGLLDFRTVETNLEKIGRDVQIFERRGPCFEAADVWQVLHRLHTGSPDVPERAPVARYLLSSHLPGVVRVGFSVVAAGFTPDLWTRGAEPVLLAFGGGAFGSLPTLRWVCGMPASELPFPFVIDDGDEITRHACEERGILRIELPPVPAGEERLLLVWAERAWRSPNGRNLGIRLDGVERSSLGPASGP